MRSDAGSVSEERSVGLAPIETKKDGAKLKQYAGVILRYVAKIDDPKPEDVDRRFIVQVYLECSTIYTHILYIIYIYIAFFNFKTFSCIR